MCTGLFRVAVLALASSLVACCPPFSLEGGALSTSPALPLATLAVAHRANIHRGASDNSLRAMRESIAAGVPYLEVDVRQSSSGDLFLFHDGSLSWQNSDAPWGLRGEKVNRLSPSVRATIPLNDGEHIPLLEEALDLIRPTGATLQLDFKGESDENVLPTLDLVQSRGQLQQVLLQIRDVSRVQTVLQRAPSARILVRVTSMSELDEALRLRVEFVELERWFSPAAIERAHGAGVKVLINVSNSRFDQPGIWRFFRSQGVDTIMTDHADRSLQDSAHRRP